MDGPDGLAQRFETQRARLRALAYRMLGSAADADDAVQEAWLRLARTDADELRSLDGWLTTVVARICLDQLRTRAVRREDPLDAHVPDPTVTFGPDALAAEPAADPEGAAVLAESVGLALFVVLDALTPAERVAFVLHDMFAVPFATVGAVLDRSPVTAGSSPAELGPACVAVKSRPPHPTRLRSGR